MWGGDLFTLSVNRLITELSSFLVFFFTFMATFNVDFEFFSGCKLCAGKLQVNTIYPFMI